MYMEGRRLGGVMARPSPLQLTRFRVPVLGYGQDPGGFRATWESEDAGAFESICGPHEN